MSATNVKQRLRRIAATGAQRVLERVEPPAPPEPAPPAAEPEPTLAGPPSHTGPALPRELAVEAQGASNVLFSRLGSAEVEEIERRVAAQPELQQLYRTIAWPDRQRALLSLGVHLDVPGIAEHTGLPTTQPPEHVHAMARGPLAAAGGLYEADMVVDALASAGVDVARVGAALDFGCSSGRVLRVLASAYPDTRWHGCDPNGDAVAFAAEAIPAAQLFVSGNHPPLDLSDASLDLVYAISIWSHFAPELGLQWLEEMQRLIRPGGHLMLTTHGTTTLEHDAIHGLRAPEQLNEARWAVVTHGSWYAAEFGEEGDWGVVNPDWGTAFLSAEWLLANACPRWRLLEFAPGRNASNQDVYVLERA